MIKIDRAGNRLRRPDLILEILERKKRVFSRKAAEAALWANKLNITRHLPDRDEVWRAPVLERRTRGNIRVAPLSRFDLDRDWR